MLARRLLVGALLWLLVVAINASIAPRSAAPLAVPDACTLDRRGNLDGFVSGLCQADAVAFASTTAWDELGPAYVPAASDRNPHTGARLGVGGRITALTADPVSCSDTGCSTLYAGAAEGGLWRSTNSGQTWHPLLNGQAVQRVSAIAIDPVDPAIIYVGTGDASRAGGAQAGLGILRSTDGGLTWQVLGTDDFGGVAIDSLVIDPRTAGGDTTVLYAGTTWAKTGSAPTYSGSRYADPRRPPYGAWLSRDSGQTWARIMPPGIHDDPVGNLLLDPSNPNNLDITFDGKGVYQTGDGGQTWAFLTRHVLHGQRFDLVRMAVAPRNPRVLCAAFEVYTQMKDYERIFRSANGGRSWRELNDTPNACGRQCFDNMLVAVDPTKPDTVYAGGTANYGYLDGSDPTCSRRIPFPHTALRPS